MKALAIIQPSHDFHKQHQEVIQAPLIQNEFPSTDAIVLQRMSACPCDGGCPRCVGDMVIQPKLRIGEPGDRYEREADRVADAVMRMPEPQMQRQVESKEEDLQMKPQSLRHADGSMAPSPDIELRIQQARGSGQPLPNNLRLLMEQTFGTGLRGVKIHTDAQSDQLSRSIHAHAFTIGRDIFFRKGEYNPSSYEGRQLIAHELTHVVQQNGDQVRRTQPHVAIDTPIVSPAPVSIMRDLTEEEREAIQQGAFRLIRSDLLEEQPLTGVPAAPEITAQAIQNLNIVRTILEDVHRDMNTVLIMLQNLEGMQIPQVFNYEFLVDALEEGADMVAIAVRDELERAVAVAAFIFKMIVLTTARHLRTTAQNEQLASRNFTIQFLLDQMMMARTQVDLLMAEARSEASLAEELAGMAVPNVPGEASREISGELEFVLTKSLIKRQGGNLALRHTDEYHTILLPYRNSEHYRVAQQRHEDPIDNFNLFVLYQYYTGFSSSILSEYIFGDWGWYFYWEVLVVEDVSEQVINHVLMRMESNGIPKGRLYHINGATDLPLVERFGVLQESVRVIEEEEEGSAA